MKLGPQNGPLKNIKQQNISDIILRKNLKLLTKIIQILSFSFKIAIKIIK